MKKFILLLITTFVITGRLFSQLSIEIDSIRISSISYKAYKACKSIFVEGLGEGPEGLFFASITNETDDFLSVDLSEMTFGYQYQYNGRVYNDYDLSLRSNTPKTILLLPGEKYSLEFNWSFLIDNTIRKDNSFDYKAEMIEIIPTIHIFYMMKDSTEKILSYSQYKKIILEGKYKNKGCYRSNISNTRFLRKLKSRCK